MRQLLHLCKSCCFCVCVSIIHFCIVLMSVDFSRCPGWPTTNAPAEAEVGGVQCDARADRSIQHGLHCQSCKVRTRSGLLLWAHIPFFLNLKCLFLCSQAAVWGGREKWLGGWRWGEAGEEGDRASEEVCVGWQTQVSFLSVLTGSILSTLLVFFIQQFSAFW